MNYGRAIKIARTAYGLTQSGLAKRLSIGASQLSLIEAGKRQPSVRVLHEVAVALDVPLHLLTLLASRPEDLNDKVDSKQVAELARALLRLLVRVGEQGTLPLDGEREKQTRRKKSA
jgi:transcriptional regulator with XRE-family HTH domain